MSDESRELVKHESPNQVVAEWGFGSMIGRHFSSLDSGSVDYKNQLFTLLNTDGVDIHDYINQKIVICTFLLQPATFADKKTSEEITTLMSKLVLDSGKVITTHSGGIAKTLLQASELVGMPTPQHPYTCTVRERPLSDNKRMFYLDFASHMPNAGRKEGK